ncbi:MAG: class I SAM-dependent methyltransferase [Proteobacteria bacterium]|nr:class I SAM-dependent methyltransferase [Pseudomonadota bacterium]MBU1714982.1 class I SAM-dependent methyltransferase [Pseudomonadota bacterium]
MRKNSAPWQQVAATFHSKAREYDNWYEKSLLFEIELSALQGLKTLQPSPKLELGVGPGRFAQALKIDLGLDPAFAPLKISQERNIIPCQAIGEMLPFKNNCLGSIFLLFTLCFLTDPQKTMKECFRVLKKDGRIIIGMVPAGSAWGLLLAKKKNTHHPFYRHASFYKIKSVTDWLAKTGFEISETKSTLFQNPDSVTNHEQASTGLDENAGFAIIAATRP